VKNTGFPEERTRLLALTDVIITIRTLLKMRELFRAWNIPMALRKFRVFPDATGHGNIL
jgi:hypothetical protein